MTAFWGTLAVSRNRAWFSEETLWRETIRTSPDSPMGYRNLGNIYLYREEYDTAIEIFSDIADKDPLYYHTIGLVALNRGDLQGAMENFKKALGRNPQFLGSLYCLGLTYEKSGELSMAAGLYRQALLSPDPDTNGVKIKAQERLASRWP
jgi:tetratricopeptide (TPR) repeat protein